MIDKMEKITELINEIAKEKIMIVIKETNFYSGIGKNKRHGRFLLDELEYKILKHNNGFYFFILKSNKYLITASIISAKHIKYQREITWTKLLELPESFTNLEVFMNG